MDKRNLLLYAITDSGCIGNRDFYEEAENALKGGVTILQLREKNITTKELTEKALKLNPDNQLAKQLQQKFFDGMKQATGE